MTWFDQIDRDGFAIVPNMVSESRIIAAAKAVNNSGLERSRAGIRHVLSLPAILEIAQTMEVLGMVRAVLGKQAIPFRATFFDKSPTSNWLVMWHQDTALPLLDKKESEGWGPWSVKDGVHYAHAPALALEQVLAVRFHLDDSNSHNGPLRILPGTHKMGVFTDEQLHELSEKVAAVDCTVPRGGLVLMRPLVVHASSKSTSAEPRRVIHIEYASQRDVLPGKTLAIA